mgnify:CR=1 FL=1
MKSILLVCNEGMSTGFLCNKMNAVAKEKGMDVRAWAIPESALEGRYQEADVILVGPQIGYLTASIQQRVNHSLPVEAINPVHFGRINADAILERALALMGAPLR